MDSKGKSTIDRYVIAIVGTSRAGKTLMANILSQSPEVFCFRELHFFGSPKSQKLNKPLTLSSAVELYRCLIEIQEKGILAKTRKSEYLDQAREQVIKNDLVEHTAVEVYNSFLLDYAHQKRPNSKPCDQTGGYIYFINEIFQLLPSSRLICMIRDPRFVISSKKRKWSWAEVRKKNYPIREWLRQKIQYHPWSLSKTWASAARTAISFKECQSLRIQKLEELKNNPVQQTREICKFLDITFQEHMCRAITRDNMEAERSPCHTPKTLTESKQCCASMGISQAELFIIQQFTSTEMQSLGYEPWPVRPNPVALGWYILVLPITLVFALIVNMKRVQNLLDGVRRRL